MLVEYNRGPGNVGCDEARSWLRVAGEDPEECGEGV